MKKSTVDLTCENDYFSARCNGPIAVFSVKGNFLLRLTILKAKEMILSYFNAAATHPDVRILLIQANPRKARREEFLCFFDMIKSARLSKNAVMRLYRTIDEIILHIVNSDLFFINVNCGEILPMSTNISLACDYRIIGDNAVFQNPALEMGLISKGGGAWFLSRILGKGKIYDLLLATHDFSAQEADALGLADACVPVAHLEKEAFAIAQRFAALPASSLNLAKRFINRSLDGLAEYLEFENQQLLSVMHERRLLK